MVLLLLACPGDEAKTSPAAESFYTPSTRHVMRTRQEVYDAFLAWFREDIGRADQRCRELWDAETEWAANWARMVLFLQQQTTA